MIDRALRRIVSVVVVSLCGAFYLGFASACEIDVEQSIRWFRNPIEWSFGSGLIPPDDAAKAKAAIEQGASSWATAIRNVDGEFLVLQEATLNQAIDISPGPCPLPGGHPLALTTYDFKPGSSLIIDHAYVFFCVDLGLYEYPDLPIYFANVREWKWNWDDDPSGFDGEVNDYFLNWSFPSVIAHEWGHVLGVVGHPTGCPTDEASLPTMRDPTSGAEGVAEESWLTSLALADLTWVARWWNVDNPNARVRHAWINRTKNTIEFDVAFQQFTDHYRLESRPSNNHPWTIFLDEILAGLGPRVFSLAGAPGPHFRVVEVSEFGDQKAVGWASLGPSTPVEPFVPSSEAELRKELAKLGVTKSAVARVGDPVVVIFGPAAWEADIGAHIGHFWNARGFAPMFRPIELYGNPLTDDEGVRTALQQAVRTLAGPPLNAVGFFLIGDSSDGDTYESEGHPDDGFNQWEHNIVPTFYFDTPYDSDPIVTDQPYAFIDGDQIPDVVITRWPITTSEELLGLAYKMQHYADGPPASMGTASIFVEDKEGNTSENEHARGIADVLASRLAQNGGASDSLLKSDIDPEWVLYDALDFWNNSYLAGRMANLVLMPASNSSLYVPGGYFSKVWESHPFRVEQLVTEYTPVVLAGTCGSANHARLETIPSLMPLGLSTRPTFHDILVSPYRGAVVWMGASSGTVQGVNRIIMEEIVKEILSDVTRPIAQSWLEALRTVYQMFPSDNAARIVAQTYVFYGDPFTTLRDAYFATPVRSETLGPPSALRQNAPNPFNPNTRISFSLERPQHVRLVVHDARGRLVASLLDDYLPVGEHFRLWNGTDASGRPVASGIYHYTLIRENGVRETKPLALAR